MASRESCRPTFRRVADFARHLGADIAWLVPSGRLDRRHGSDQGRRTRHCQTVVSIMPPNSTCIETRLECGEFMKRRSLTLRNVWIDFVVWPCWVISCHDATGRVHGCSRNFLSGLPSMGTTLSAATLAIRAACAFRGAAAATGRSRPLCGQGWRNHGNGRLHAITSCCPNQAVAQIRNAAGRECSNSGCRH